MTDRLIRLLRGGAGILAVILTVAYPFAVWAALRQGALLPALGVLAGAVICRILSGGMRGAGERLTAGAGILMLILASCCQVPEVLLLYPAAVSFGFLLVFGLSLRSTPAVERIASLRISPEERTPFFRRYCRTVTEVWCVFLFLNGTAAAVLAALSRDLWMIYTGSVSYVLMGLLFGAEYLVRIRLRSRLRDRSGGSGA